MPSGDPMWRCPHCGQIYYSNCQTACSCGGAYSSTYTFSTNEYCGCCATHVPQSRVLCDVCGPPYPPEPPTQTVNFSVDGKQTKTMPNPNYSYPKNVNDELSRLFDDMFNPKQPVPKTEKITIRLPELPRPKTQSLNEVADEVPGKSKTTNEKDQERLDAIYNDMLDRQDALDMQGLIDELIEEERRKDDQAAREVLEATVANARKKTLVVNLFAGPGAGKSTTAAGIFFDLKCQGINCELTNEFCKDLSWEERHQTFKDQIYIFGKQYHRIFRLLNQVDVIVCDSPLLLTVVYDGDKRDSLKELVYEEHRKMWTYNAFIKRVKPFNPKGRVHGFDEAKGVDHRILDALDDAGECYEVFEGTPAGKDAIVKKVLMLLEHNGMLKK